MGERERKTDRPDRHRERGREKRERERQRELIDRLMGLGIGEVRGGGGG